MELLHVMFIHFSVKRCWAYSYFSNKSCYLSLESVGVLQELGLSNALKISQRKEFLKLMFRVKVLKCLYTHKYLKKKIRYNQPRDITLGALTALQNTNDDGECDVFEQWLLALWPALKFAIGEINRPTPASTQNSWIWCMELL